MRIVQLNPYHYPYRGGIEHRIHEVCAGLSSRHELIVLTSRLPGTYEEEKVDGYRIIRLPSRYLRIYNPPFVSTPGVLEALRSLDPDLVDFHYRWAPSYTKAMKRYDGNWLFTFHNTYGEGNGPSRALSVLNDARFCRLIRDRRVVCVTEFIKRDLISRGFREELLSVIPVGVHPHERQSSEEDFILFTGRLVGTKGLRYLIEAMPNVRSKLVIMGQGPELPRLQAQASRLGVEDRIEFLGHVDEETKERLMSCCKVFVMPSLYESLGLAVAEAMTHGKPVVASRVGGLPEVVGEGGTLVEPRRPDQIAEALNRLLADDGLRRSKAEEARKHIRGYSWECIIPQLEKLYIEEGKK